MAIDEKNIHHADKANEPVITEKKWLICIEKRLVLTDVMQITQYHDQGWDFHELDNYYSGMIRASRIFEVEADYIDLYIKALESCTDFTILWYEEAKAK